MMKDEPEGAPQPALFDIRYSGTPWVFDIRY